MKIFLVLASIITLFVVGSMGISYVDARCPGGHPECGPPGWNQPNITNLDGWSIDSAYSNEQYLISVPLRNYVWIFEPCKEYETRNAVSLGEYNKTIPIEKCVSGGKWILDEIVNEHPPSPVLVLVQIKDENNITQHLAWIEAEIPPNDEKSFEFSWMPTKLGQHKIMTFVWKSFENPTALKSPTSMMIHVIDDVNSTKIDTSKTMELNLASPVEFADDGRDIQRSVLQKYPAPRPMYDSIMDSMEDGVSVSSDGVATITSIAHEKYSVNPDTGFYAEDWMPEHIPEGQKLLYTGTTCYEKTGDCGLGIHFVPTTFVLHENVTSYDLEVSKGFMISVKYSSLPLDSTKDIIEEFKESRESQSGNYGRFVEMIRDGKIVSGYEGGNDYNHYHASVYFQPDDHTGVGVHSNYHSLEELIPIFESVMK